VESVFISVT